MYVSVGGEAQSCISMKIIKTKNTLGDGLVTDFVKPDKVSIYDLNDVPDNNFRFDTSLRLLPNPNMTNGNKITFAIVGENG